MRAREPLSALLSRLAAQLWPAGASGGTSLGLNLAARHVVHEASAGSNTRLISLSTTNVVSASATAGASKNVSGTSTLSNARQWRQATTVADRLHTVACGQLFSGSRTFHSSPAPGKPGKSSKPVKEQPAPPAASEAAATAAEVAPPPVESTVRPPQHPYNVSLPTSLGSLSALTVRRCNHVRPKP